jgi:hypothetical protein
MNVDNAVPVESFSFSKLNDYSSCPMIYYFRYMRGIYPAGKAKALAFGACMAEALRTYRTEASFDLAAKTFQETWEREGKVLKLRYDPEDPKDFRTVQRGLEILDAYIETYPNEPELVIQPEVKFELDFNVIRNTPVVVTGRIDGVMSNGRGGAQINEDKTTSRLGPFFFEQLRGSLQIGLYLYAAEEYGLFEIGGKRTTPTCLMNAMKVHPKEFKFMREPAIKSRRNLDAFRRNAVNWISQILRSREEGLFPMNDVDNSMCTKYGGCDYLPLKYASGNMLRSVLKNGYIRKYKEGDEYKVAKLTDEDFEEVQAHFLKEVI